MNDPRNEYDDHCYINFMKQEWRIVGMVPGRMLLTSVANPGLGAIVDISEVDWEGYGKDAVNALHEHYRRLN